jgi:glycosyltransferase involved in cell wall biosynthesis
LRERFEHGVLGEMVNKAAEIEPLIAQCWREAMSVKLPPFHSDHVVSQTVAMHNMQHDAGFKRAKTVVVIPHCRLSGATRIAGYLTTALAELQGESEVVVISSDLDIMMFPDWFPANCRHVSLAKHAHDLPRALQEKLLVEFIRSLGATQVFNVNSSLFWDAFKSFGKALSVTTDVYAYFFCNDKDSLGHWVGYPLQKFYRHFDMLSGVITDSHVLAEELSTRYIVPEAQQRKLVTLETPVPEVPPIAPTPVHKAKRRPTFFWSGRFDRQKRVDVAFAIARKMPDCDFRFWGEPVLDRQDSLGDVPGNVSMQGTYASLDELPFEECDAWLYTSEWDGVPNILIEIAARAVPLVGSIAGGTGEILKPDMSWPVDGIEDVDAYVAGLRTVISDQDDARAKALRLRHDVLTRRTSEIYRSSLETFLKGSRRIEDAS